MNDREHPLGDRSRIDLTPRQVAEIYKTHEIELTPEAYAGIYLTNNHATLVCYTWMAAYFNLVADVSPNGECAKNGLGEIELDWDHKTPFYKLYKEETEEKGDPTIGKRKFFKLWNSVFPHVRIKKYKSCGGKIE